jgi:hypothetical protein
MRKAIDEGIARALLEQSRLPEAEVASRLSRARSTRYWEGLNPGLTLAGIEVCRPAEDPIDPGTRRAWSEAFATGGYLRTEPVFTEAVLAPLRHAVRVVVDEGWPAVFTFVYDQFWALTRQRALAGLLSAVLGPGVRQSAAIWTHHVPDLSGAAGWPPHMDYPARPGRLTVWIPLTDATVETGCIGLVPKDQFPRGIADGFETLEMVSMADVLALLHRSRILPARAGSVLCWDGRVLHWGTARGGAGGPRITVSYEFLGGRARPTPRESPVFDVDSPLPTFDERLRMIGVAILAYHKREPRQMRHVALASRLIEPLRGAPGDRDDASATGQEVIPREGQ